MYIQSTFSQVLSFLIEGDRRYSFQTPHLSARPPRWYIISPPFTGASAYFRGGSVIYTRDAQKGLLGVPNEAMEDIRAATEAYALLNARTVRERLGTTWGLSETGASGPSGNRYGDDAGHACIAVAGPVERSAIIETGDTDREANMWAFTRAALDLLEECMSASG